MTFADTGEIKSPQLKEPVIIDGPGGGLGTISLYRRESGLLVPETTLEDATERLIKGEFDVPLESEDVSDCGDGRRYAQSGIHRAKMFGGTLGLVIEDAMSGLSVYRDGQEDQGQHTKRFVGSRTKQGLLSGNHTDDHANGPNCGCGACDKAEPAARLIITQPKLVKEFVGVFYEARKNKFNESLFDQTVNTTSELLEGNYFVSGSEVTQVLEEEVGKNSIVERVGPHLEGIYRNQGKPQVTTAIDAFAREFEASNLQTFGEDEAAIQKEHARLVASEKEFAQLQMASRARRMAVALTLTAGDLRLVFS